MTTIAFKDGVMAADSKCTDDHGAFLTKCRKIDRLANGALLGQSGDGDARELFALLGKATPKRLPSRAELAETKVDFHGILAFPNGRVFMVYVYTHDIGSSDSAWTGQIIEMEERICAVGSGQQFVLLHHLVDNTLFHCFFCCKHVSTHQQFHCPVPSHQLG